MKKLISLLLLFSSLTLWAGIPIGLMETTIPGLVGWWPMNEGSGTVSTADKSGYARTSYLTNSPVWTNGVAGYGLRFNGTNYISTLNRLSDLGLDYNVPWSICLWVYPESLASPESTVQAKLFGVHLRADADGGTLVRRGIYCTVNTNSSLFTMLCQDTSVLKQWELTTASIISSNVWVNIVWTYNGGNTASSGKLYVNAVVKASTATGNAITDTVTTTNQYFLYFGCENYPPYPGYNPGPNQLFTGRFDDVRIYNRVLTANEIKQLYNGGCDSQH